VAVSGNVAYDGKLNCFWGEYGNNPMVGLFVPTIVFAGTPPPQTQNLSSITLENRAYARHGAMSYLPERVREIQSYLFPAEDYTFAEYENLISSIPDGLNDSELGSILNNYIVDSVSYAVAQASEYERLQAQLTLKLSGEFDYMPQENTKIKISALVTYTNASDPVPGAKVTVRIYDPRNTLWVSDNMIEIDKGIHTWESNETVTQVIARSGEGVFIVYARASKEGFLDASDIVEFRIDPSAASNNDNGQLPMITGVAFVVTAALLLTVIYFAHKLTRKETKPQAQKPQPETKPQAQKPQPETKPQARKPRKARVRRTKAPAAEVAT
jgi:Na+-transporting methylmalonyl-CoA/oxaloacetate decarboxylase gamma subunit